MRYCKPVAVHFEIRGSTKVIDKRRQGPGPIPPEKVDSLCGKQEHLESRGKGENIIFRQCDV